MSETVQLTAADGFLCPAYMSRPDGPAMGAVVVLQEIFGVNAHIRAITDGYAAQGYLALAPATFQRVKQNVELGYAPADMEAGRGLKATVEALAAPGVMADIQTAIDYAARAGSVALVGYCWRGLLAWRSACGLTRLSAVASYYGGGMSAAGPLPRANSAMHSMERRRRGVAPTEVPGVVPFWRPGPLDFTRQRGGVQAGTAAGRGAALPCRPRIQL